MSILGRVIKIIKSNMHYENNDTNFDNFSATFENENTEDFNVETPQNNINKNSQEEEYYANLELPYGANFEQIKVAYKNLLKKYHPDRFYGDEKKIIIAQNVIKKLNIAYEYFEKKFNK